jgi:hypothetical protein
MKRFAFVLFALFGVVLLSHLMSSAPAPAGAAPAPAPAGLPPPASLVLPPAETVISVRLDPHVPGSAAAALNGRLRGIDEHWLVMLSGDDVYYIPREKVLFFTVRR